MNRDVPLTKALARGSRSAFNLIYQRYSDKVYWVSRGMHLQEVESQEIVQEVFMTLWEKRAGLRTDASLNSYLLTITRNKIINFQNRKAARLYRNQVWQDVQSPNNKSAEEEVIYQDMEDQTLRFIRTLPLRNRQIFMLSRRLGFSNEEIARRLRLSKRTVENNIYRAEKAIHRFLLKSKLIIPH